MRSLRSERGQATVDYVALIGLLMLLLAAVATVTMIGAPGVANAVLSQFRHALCVVGGGDCPPPPRPPCTVASTRDAHHLAVNVLLVRIDDDTAVLRERLSDGTVRLTLSQHDGAGVEGGVGGKAKVDVRGREIGVEREARAGVQGVLGHGEVYYARDDLEADRLLDEIRRALPGGGPRASEVFYEGGVRGLGRVKLGGAHIVSGSLDAMASAMLGARHDRRTGQTTLSLSAGGSGGGLVSLLLGGGAATLDGQAVLGLVLDAEKRPAELTLSASGKVADGVSLPSGIVDALVGAIPGTSSWNAGGRRWELGARADLHDPAVAAAWKVFRGAPASPAAIQALGSALQSHATVDVRAYATHGSSNGIRGSVALGLKLGGETEHAVDHAKLLAATRRPPFGVWEDRLDCGVV